MALQLPFPATFSGGPTASSSYERLFSLSLCLNCHRLPSVLRSSRRRSKAAVLVFSSKEDTEVRVEEAVAGAGGEEGQQDLEEESDPDPQDLEYVAQIKRV